MFFSIDVQRAADGAVGEIAMRERSVALNNSDMAKHQVYSVTVKATETMIVPSAVPRSWHCGN